MERLGLQEKLEWAIVSQLVREPEPRVQTTEARRCDVPRHQPWDKMLCAATIDPALAWFEEVAQL